MNFETIHVSTQKQKQQCTVPCFEVKSGGYRQMTIFPSVASLNRLLARVLGGKRRIITHSMVQDTVIPI